MLMGHQSTTYSTGTPAQPGANGAAYDRKAQRGEVALGSTLAGAEHQAETALLPRMLIGGVSGLAATGPMTVTMLALQQMLPRTDQYPLPPRRIVDRLAGWLGIRHDANKTELNALTGLAHFGYGAAAGALYGPIGLALPLPGVVSGITYGLLVWTGSYLGVLPALGLLSPATRHPAPRNALMIAAHVVW